MDKRKAVSFLIVSTCLTVITVVYYRTNTIVLTCQKQLPELTCRKQLPAVLVIGAPKCGTAALSAFLSHHPGIAIDGKRELNFFSKNYDLGFDWYKDNLPCSMPGQLVIERSSNYIRIDVGVVHRVWNLNPEMKLILVVCEPVRRLISQFAMALERHKIPNASFEETFFPNKPREKGSWITQFMVNSNFSFSFSAWLRAFPLEQFHIVDGDNLKSKPWEELNSTEHFLGVKPYIRKNNFVKEPTKGFYCFRDRRTEEAHCLTPTKGRQHPEVSEIIKARLRKFYSPYNEIFYKQCGRTFNW